MNTKPMTCVASVMCALCTVQGTLTSTPHLPIGEPRAATMYICIIIPKHMEYGLGQPLKR